MANQGLVQIRCGAVRRHPVLDGIQMRSAFVFTEVDPPFAEFDQLIAVNDTKVATVDKAAMEKELVKFEGKPVCLTVQRMHLYKIRVEKKKGDHLGIGCGMSRDGRRILVTSVSHAAAKTDLREFDQVIAINNTNTATIQDMRSIVTAGDGTGTFEFAVLRPVLVPNKPAAHSKEPVHAKSDISVPEPPQKTSTEIPKPEATAPAAKPEPPKPQAAAGPPTEAVVRLQFDEGEQVGVFVDEQLVVTSIQPGSLAEDAFVIGDHVKLFNGFPVNGKHDLYKRFQKGGNITVKVLRSGSAPDPERRVHAVASPAAPVTAEAGEAPPSDSTDHVATVAKFRLPDGEPLGVVPNENCKVMKVQEGTVGAQHFHPGDILKSVNDEPVTGLTSFEHLINKHRPQLIVVLDRSKYREAEVESRQLPDNVEQMITRHAGFDYVLSDVRWSESEGRPFGLSLANCAHNRVIVTTVKAGSVAADHFKAFDRVIAINGTPVTDENVAKEYICATGGTFQAVVERPRTVERWQEIKNQYQSWRAQASRPRPAEDVLPADAMRIAHDEMQRRKGQQTAKRGILKQQPSNPNRQTDRPLSISERAMFIEIASDTPPGKQLRRLA